MASDSDPLNSALAALIGGLRPRPGGGTEADLAEASRLAARAVAAGLAAPTAGQLTHDQPHDLAALLAHEVADDTPYLVHRRTLPTLTPAHPTSLPPWAVGRAVTRTLGPFADAAGRDTWIDLYRIVRHVRLVRVSGGAPFLTLDIQLFRFPPLPPPAKHLTYNVPAGSVWFASPLLASAPAGSYTGLAVTGGTLHFSQAVTVVRDEVVVPMGTIVTLDIALQPETAFAGTGPGGDARNTDLSLPTNAVLTVDGATATLATTDTARLLVYGQDTTLDPTGGPITYEAELQALAMPFTPSLQDFDVSQVASTMFVPDGKAAISRAAWVLPVAVVDPSQLGDASGEGGLALWLDHGLQATWTGQVAPVALGPLALEALPGRLTVWALQASGDRVEHTPGLAGLPHSRLLLHWGAEFPLYFVSQAAGSELVLTDAGMTAALEEPVDVRGEPLPLDATAILVALIDSGQGVFLLVEGALQPPTFAQVVCFGLVNALLRSTYPTFILLLSKYDGTTLQQGIALLGYRLLGLVPTLPDPYAASFVSLRSYLDQGSAPLISTLGWSAARADLQFILPSGLQVHRAGGQQQLTVPTQEARSFNSDQSWRKALGNALAFEQLKDFVLLDVSTNVDQFGVAFVSGHGERNAPPPVLKDLTLQLDGEQVALVTLPAVQWEVVQTVSDPDPFPARLSFLNSGVPTVMVVDTVNLVPVHPQAVLKSVVDNFAGANPTLTEARFTLPFGMLASAQLRAPEPAAPRGATVAYNMPAKGTWTGAHQLRIDAVDPSLAPGESASLEGFTVQLPIGQPGGLSVLGTDVTNIFNTYLGAAGARPLIPVTRLDLSGYGESLFSDWHNPYHVAGIDDVDVIQARFDVMVGRTALEVVQVKSYLFPYAVEVVRTITMHRLNTGVVTRTDSGWQPISDGVYDFGNGIITHPGVVPRLTNVGHIRDTGQIVTYGGKDMAAVYFDGDLQLDGAGSLVPARDQFGFVQITAGGLLDPGGYADLIAGQGALGGLVDASLNVGSGHQTFHVQRVDVGVTAGMGGPEFVMTAWGAPAFPGGGQWSVLQVDNPTTPPVAVPKDRGLPLIRAGAAGSAPPPGSPYRFSDPIDLAQPTNPVREYGIVHSTGTQRVLYPRPKIEATAVNEITSTEIPVLADPYVLASAPGPFPALVAGVPFPSATWALQVDGAGEYKLAMGPSTFPVTVGRRTVRQAGSVKSDLDYTAASVTYELDTSQPVPWLFRLDNVAKIMSTSGLGDVVQLRADVVAQYGVATTFEHPQMAMGGALSVVQDLLTILADLGISGILSVDMTNDWSLKLSMKVPFVDPAGKSLQIPPLVPNPEIVFDDTGIQVSIKVAPDMDEAEFSFGGHPMFAIQSIPDVYVVAIIKFSIKLSTVDGTTYGLLLGVGLAFSIDGEILSFKGLIALTFFGFISDSAMGFGIGFLMQLSAAIEPIIEIQISLEGQLALVRACMGTPDESLFSVAKLTFAVEVTVCLVFSIDIEVSTTAHETLQGPGDPACAVPDVLPSAS